MHNSPVCCVAKYDLSLELRHGIVDLSNLVHEEERNAEQIEKRSTMVIQTMNSPRLNNRRSLSGKHVKNLYPSTEILDTIEDIDIQKLLTKSKLTHNTLQHRQLSQFPSQNPSQQITYNNGHVRHLDAEEVHFTAVRHATDHRPPVLKSVPDHRVSHRETQEFAVSESSRWISSQEHAQPTQTISSPWSVTSYERETQVARLSSVDQRPSAPERWKSVQEKMHQDDIMPIPSDDREPDLRRSVQHGRRTETDDRRFLARNRIFHADLAQPRPPKNTSSMTQLEIAPGVFALLRGAEETWNAVENGNIVHCECICCTMQLVCIADAEFVLCPECRVVNPLPKQSNHIHNHVPDARGVGLGMSLDEYNAQLDRNHRYHHPRRSLTALGGGGQHGILPVGYDRGWTTDEDHPRTYGRYY